MPVTGTALAIRNGLASCTDEAAIPLPDEQGGAAQRAQGEGLTVHPKWTVPELRSILSEERAKEKKVENNVPKGLSSMTLLELKKAAEDLRIPLPDNTNRGLIMRMIRDSTQDKSENIMNFGRYAGYLYREVPMGYRKWAQDEVQRSSNASEDLRMFAMWAEQDANKKKVIQTKSYYADPEATATVPYNPEEESNWEVVTGGDGILFERYTNERDWAADEGRLCRPMTAETTGADAPPGTRADRAQGHVTQQGDCERTQAEDATGTTGPRNHGPRREGDRHGGPGGDQGAGDATCSAAGSPPPSSAARVNRGAEADYEEYEDPQEYDDACSETSCEVIEVNEVMIESFMNPETAEEMNTAGLPRPNDDLAIEIASYAASGNNDFSYQTLCRLADLLPADAQLKVRQSAKESRGRRGIVGGVWTHGKMAGVTKNLAVFPWFTKYLGNWASHHGVPPWTTFMLTENVSHGIHSDNHNLAGYPNSTTSFGNFVGGELWVEAENYEVANDNETYVWRTDNGGKERAGQLLNTKEKIVNFDPKMKHATQPWSGTRWCLTYFASRGLPNIDRPGRDLLRRLGMTLPDLRKRPPLHDHHPRAVGGKPAKRSDRRMLMKNLKRLGALATWTVLAAGTYLDAHLPPPGDPQAVTLCEMGGTHKTFEAMEAGYLATEPLDRAFLLQEGGREHGLELIQTLRPSTLWVHGDNLIYCEEIIDDYVQEQIRSKRRVVVEATPHGPFWESGVGGRLIQDPVATIYGEGEFKLVEINGARADWDEANETTYPGAINVYMAQSSTDRPERPVQEPRGASAISFPGEPRVKPEVASALRRLHANLGHPSQHDLTRHLRLAGAGPEVIQASKRMSCETCKRCTSAASARPASLPNLLSFNQVVGVDAFSVVDSTGKRYEMLSAYDHGTSFHVVGELGGHSTEAMERTFCEIWSRTFGAPGTIALDLESGLQAGLARYSSWHGCHLRPIAGQAHWQLGATERHGGLWKAIWKRVCDDLSLREEDVPMGIAAVNDAKNQLRRMSGYSPAQAVFGRDPYIPGELLDERDGA